VIRVKILLIRFDKVIGSIFQIECLPSSSKKLATALPKVIVHMYMIPVVSYIYWGNAQYAHLGWLRVVISKS
jgi:hypothetical protein